MAGLKDLGDVLQHSEDEGSDDDGEFVIYESPRGIQTSSSDEPPLDIRVKKKGWRKYAPAMKNFVPIRPSGKSGGEEGARVDEAGCLSFITYGWVFGYLWSAFRGLIPRDQTWACSFYDSASINITRIEYLWKEEVKIGRKGGPSLGRVVLRFFRTRLILASIVFLFCLTFGFIGPTCLVKAIIAYAEDSQDKTLMYGVSLALALFVVELCRVLAYGACWAISYRTGIRVRGAVLGFLYKKLLTLRTLKSKTPAEIVNIYGNDGQRLFDAVTFAPLVLMGPLVLIGGLIYLIVVIGPWSLMGVLVFFIFDVFQVALGKTMVKYRKLAIAKTESRISLMGEILKCIRMIKMNAWEQPFMDRITQLRQEEKRYLRTAAYAQSLAIASGPVVPVVAAILTFIFHIMVGHGTLLPSEAFSAITIFFVMVFGIRMIPYGMRYVAEAMVGLRAIQTILQQTEADLLRPPPLNSSLSIVIQDATFAWDDAASPDGKGVEIQPLAVEETTVLRGINLIVEKKKLIGVCGPVASGKSALLNAIIGQLIQQDGTMSIGGGLAYSAQSPWVLNATVRENILFGKEFEDKRYYHVLSATALHQDINNMPANDQTEIGERGVTLSGGQKARISLARALYSNKDIYLLDDILSSLDVSVADHVFNYAIKGMLLGKTVLLVTNNATHLEKCDEIVFMSSGRIQVNGSHDDLMRTSENYASFIEASEAQIQNRAPVIENLLGDNNSEPQTPLIQRTPSEASLMKRKMELRQRSNTAMSGTESFFDLPAAVAGQMMDEEEDLGLQSMSWHVYGRYLRAAGGACVLFCVVLSFMLNVGSSVFATVWLSVWLKSTNASMHLDLSNSSSYYPGSHSPEFYAGVYGSSVIILMITSVFKAVIWVKVSLNAASRLHTQMFQRLMHGVIRFFDSTPTGRILNRFSRDLDEIDVKLPFTAESFLQNIFTIAAYIVAIACIFPWFLVACVPLALIFAIFVACFRAGIRSLKRSENLSRSPLFDHITSSLEGLATIHAFGQNKRFLERLKQLLDANSAAMFMFQSAMRWLAVWLDLLVVLITFITALLIILHTGQGIPPAYAGMALAFSIQMSGIFNFAVRMQTELEAKMTSVERINYYIEEIEDEGPWFDGEVAPPIDWPERGRLSFRDVRLKYRENLPHALKGVSFDIKAQEKVGIVGRTGSGKSSLGVALFRLYPLSGGSISVDEVDASSVGLHKLRGRMEAIPQDPVLFSGSFRFNLDPLRQHSDDQLWAALEKTNMKHIVGSLEGGLDTEVKEGGGNLSAGQKQLICMARALLRHVRLLLLDEATSSLDSEMDARIQTCLREHFRDCTTLVIAHRLSSIIHSDKILFMDSGRIIEFDQPKILMEDPKSRFYQMALRSDPGGLDEMAPARSANL